MKAFIISITAGLLIVSGAYSLDSKTKTRMIELYNLTRNQYILVIELLNDVGNSEIEADTAREKLNEWKTRYHEKVGYIPQEAQKMCDLMNEIMDVSQDITDDYEPNNQRTKDMFNDLENIKRKFLHEMNRIKYLLQ